MPLNEITIKLDKYRKTYCQGERLSGHVVIENKYELRHEGILLTFDGAVDLNFNLRGINLIDPFHGWTKNITLAQSSYQLKQPGKLTPGRIELPFTLLIDGLEESTTLYETYHGVFISIQYFLKCRIKRPLLFRDLVEQTEIMIEYDPSPIGALPLDKKSAPFSITPDQLSASSITRRDVIPDFKITGHLDSLTCYLNEPISGQFIIEHCEATIKSVELQLVRIETCGLTPDEREYSQDATEVQNIQIGDGDLLRNTPIDISMILPRSFTCPTITTSDFKIEFEVNLVIVFDDNYLITENFPIELIRSTIQPINLT